MHIPILKGVQNGRISQQKKSIHILLTKFHFEDLFPNGICFLYFLSIYPKCLFIQLLNNGIRMRIQGHLYTNFLF